MLYLTNRLNIILIVFFSVCTHSVAGGIENSEHPQDEQLQETVDMTDINDNLLEKLSSEERSWYTKFQEGTMLFSGWKEISEDVLTSLPADERENAQRSLKKLGIRIGMEWSKDNAVRKIDTDMLRSWGSQLKKAKKAGSAKLLQKISEISSEVDKILEDQSSSARG